jgi:hypothetical protein
LEFRGEEQLSDICCNGKIGKIGNLEKSNMPTGKMMFLMHFVSVFAEDVKIFL